MTHARLDLDQLTEHGMNVGDDDGKSLIIACGALAREVLALIKLNDWSHLSVTCLPAILHNTPENIPPAVENAIVQARNSGTRRIYVLYADCGTGGLLDTVCARHGVERIEGPHCYAFFSGVEHFAAQGDADMRSFYLTDFLARQFDAFVTRPLGLDRHPELRDMYFGHYEKLVFLAQTEDPDLTAKAQKHAALLGLDFERRFTGYGDLESALASFAGI